MALWLRKLIHFFGYSEIGPTIVAEDNQGAITYCESMDRAGRMKHIDVKYFWIREHITDGVIQLAYIPTTENVADIMTKTLGGKLLKNHRASMGLVSFLKRKWIHT
jgi:hypothetical protein